MPLFICTSHGCGPFRLRANQPCPIDGYAMEPYVIPQTPPEVSNIEMRSEGVPGEGFHPCEGCDRRITSTYRFCPACVPLEPKAASAPAPTVDVSVEYHAAAEQPTPEDSLSWLTFAGFQFSADPRALADAMGSRWEAAMSFIFSRDGHRQLELWAAQFRSAELSRVVDQTSPQSALGREAQLVRLIRTLWNLPLGVGASRGVSRYWFRGLALDPKRVGALAASALQFLEASGSDGSIEPESDDALIGLELIRGGLVRTVAKAPTTPLSVLVGRFTEGRARIGATLRSQGLQAPRTLLEYFDLELLVDLCSVHAAAKRHAAANQICRVRPDLLDIKSGREPSWENVAIEACFQLQPVAPSRRRGVFTSSSSGR